MGAGEDLDHAEILRRADGRALPETIPVLLRERVNFQNPREPANPAERFVNNSCHWLAFREARRDPGPLSLHGAR